MSENRKQRSKIEYKIKKFRSEMRMEWRREAPAGPAQYLALYNDKGEVISGGKSEIALLWH